MLPNPFRGLTREKTPQKSTDRATPYKVRDQKSKMKGKNQKTVYRRS